tara:strand:+ start:369 stop:746 length:378 start_codon:yes stop_codon:yes gene_type:complete
MSTIKANTLLHSDGSTTTQPSIPALDTRMATAWVAFNGTGTVAIKGDYGVSSITDLDTGDYQINFSTNRASVTYSATACTYRQIGWGDGGINVRTHTVSSVRVTNVEYSSGAGADSPYVSVNIFG